MASTQFTLYITNEGINRARETLTNPGWYLIPYKIGIASSRGVIDATRTYASMDTANTWYLDSFSGITAGTVENKLIHSVVVPPTITGYTTSQNYGELYFIYKDHNGNEFLYAIGAPQDTLMWTPGISQQFYFAFTLNNTTVADTFNIQYTYPQDISDHNTSILAHDFLLKRDGSRTATGILSYDANKTFTSGNNIVNKTYVDNFVPANAATRTLSNITSLDASFKTLLLNALFPVGATYGSITNSTTCPLQTSLGGTWALLSSGKAIWTGNGSNAGNTIAAGLPNPTGAIRFSGIDPRTTTGDVSGAFTKSLASGAGNSHDYPVDNARVKFTFNASNSSSIYGNSSTVQPPAYVVNVWRRTA